VLVGRRRLLVQFTTAQVDFFLVEEYGGDYKLKDPSKFAVFEDHLIYATGVPSMAKFADKIERLREVQREFVARTGVRNYSAVDGVSPGICHQVAREQFIDPGDFVQATDRTRAWAVLRARSRGA
jgi:3-isopropylmalate/(R)-2-methylmalate dehydratase large subunit